MISPTSLLSGMDSFGPYRVLEDLGAVPYGTLYRVVDTRSEEPAMLKVIPPSLQGGWQGSAPWEILLRETEALARIYHRALPSLLEVSEHDGELLVAFAPVDGMSLRDWLAEGGRPDRALLAEWGVEILEALQEAHAAGILHRHVGEDEVFITAEGQVVLTGLGLTQLTFDPLVPLPPEQRPGEPFTEQSDLYALGALLDRLAFVSGLRSHTAEPGAGPEPLRSVARFQLPGRAVEEGAGRDTGEGDRRNALLFLASSILLLACLILAGWLVLELELPSGPAAAPSSETVEAPGAPSPRSPA